MCSSSTLYNSIELVKFLCSLMACTLMFLCKFHRITNLALNNAILIYSYIIFYFSELVSDKETNAEEPSY